MKTSVLSLLLALLFAAVAGPLHAAPQLASPALESDDLLLEGLDGLLDDLPAPESAPNPEPPAGGGGEDLGTGADNPLTRIEQGMATAEQLIAGPLVTEQRGSAKASRVQQQVISDLDELIKQAEKQCQQCQSASSSSSSQSQGRQKSQRSQPKPGDAKQQAEVGKPQPGGKPGKQQGKKSVARLQAAKAAAAAGQPPEELMKEVWGRLPQRLREQMLESSSDEFLPQYREEIEQYFRRLAEQPE